MAVALVAAQRRRAGRAGLIRAHDWRLLGAVAYWLFDNLVLYACLAAFGDAPSFWVVAMAYLVGMLANSIPVPGGFLAVEGGLVAMLLLFGVRPAAVVIAAVHRLPRDLAVGAGGDRLDRVPEPAPGDRQAGRPRRARLSKRSARLGGS